MTKRVVLKIYGDVQGVFFRDSARRMAGELNLSGFARNEGDGSVYVEAEGDEENLEKMIEWCRSGGGKYKVDKADVERLEASGKFNGFEIKPQ